MATSEPTPSEPPAEPTPTATSTPTPTAGKDPLPTAISTKVDARCGSDPGVNTVVVLFPKSQRGLIVFTNGDNGVKIWTRILAEAFDVGKEMLGRA